MSKTYILSYMPEEICMKIYEEYYKKYIVEEIKQYRPSILWEQPSDSLLDKCIDNGCFQTGNNVYCGLEDLFKNEISDEYNNIISYNDYNTCSGFCGNCRHYGFPCVNCACYCSKKIGIFSLWRIGNSPKVPLDIEIYTSINRKLKSRK